MAEEKRKYEKRTFITVEDKAVDLGNRLRTEREKLGWTVYMAAKCSDLDSHTIKVLESGRGTIQALLKYFTGLGKRVVMFDPDGAIRFEDGQSEN